MTVWSKESIERSIELLQSGFSASAAAEVIVKEGLREECSRNAMIGIWTRHAKTKGVFAVKVETPTKQVVQNNVKKRLEVLKTIEMIKFHDGENHNAILNLKRNQCRWPIGDPYKKDFRFCENKISDIADGPYCPEHRKIAYIPSKYSQK
jgi:hypothetical protein